MDRPSDKARGDHSESPPLGSYAWLEQTGGTLSPRQRLQLLPNLLATFGRFLSDRTRWALRRGDTQGLDADALWPRAPDSRLCSRAVEEARQTQSDVLLNHAYRTWIYGHALSVIDGAALDPEEFHIASLLHDAAIEQPQPGQCFTYRSAEAARRVAQHTATPVEAVRDVMDGIAHHITPGLAAGDSALGYYLQCGAMADFLGLRIWRLPRPLVDRIAREYPRLNAHRHVSKLWREEARAVPGGRADFAHTYGAFAHVVRFFPTHR